jgi:acetyl-CoA carboxylase biotin carboxyl carrier protein
MKFDINYIEKLAKILNDSSLTEISLEDGEAAITIRREVPVIAAPQMPAQIAATPQAVSLPVQNDVAKIEAHKGNPIVSPIVGTFYCAPAPGEEPFVKVGDEITKGSKVCIIEAMKLMNEIESDFSGKVTEICVTDGQPVEFGQVLMYVE